MKPNHHNGFKLLLLGPCGITILSHYWPWCPKHRSSCFQCIQWTHFYWYIIMLQALGQTMGQQRCNPLCSNGSGKWQIHECMPVNDDEGRIKSWRGWWMAWGQETSMMTFNEDLNDRSIILWGPGLCLLHICFSIQCLILQWRAGRVFNFRIWD